MITANEAATITCIVKAKKEDKISAGMKEFIGKQIVKAAAQGGTRTGFTFGGDKDYCLAVAKWVANFGYSSWFDNSREPAILWIGWNAQVMDLKEKGE